MTITQAQIDHVQKLHDDHAALNDESADVVVYVRRDKMYWKAPHKVTGKMMHALVPLKVYAFPGDA